MNDPNNLKSFSDHGFFSEYAEKWSKWYAETNPKLFINMSAVNDIAHELMRKPLNIEKEIPYLDFYIFTALFMRAVTNFQSAFILLQKGLAQEARILTRSCLECAFMLGAATKMGAVFVERIIRSHNQSRKKFGESIERLHKAGANFTDEEVQSLKTSIIEHVASGIQSFDFAEISKKSDLEHWYIFYRMLSNSSAHPSLDSLEYFFDGETNDIIYQPNSDEYYIKYTNELLLTFMITCCQFFNEHLMKDQDIATRLQAEFDKIERWRVPTLPA